VSAEIGDATVFLRPAGGAWQFAAAIRGALTVTYEEYASGRPSIVRIRAASEDHVTADLTLHLSEIETNTTLDPRTFDIAADLPPRPVPLTLEELRRAGPLGGGG
jgi:hypothetical protein